MTGPEALTAASVDASRPSVDLWPLLGHNPHIFSPLDQPQGLWWGYLLIGAFYGD